MSKQAKAPLMIQLHHDGAHLVHDGEDHGVISPDCLTLITSHRRAVREMLDAMKVADHAGEPAPDEQKRLNETDEAEMLGALLLANHRLVSNSRADKIAVELHAEEFASRSELLQNLIPIPDCLVTSLAETVIADPVRAMAGRGRRSPSDFTTIERLVSTLDNVDAELVQATKLAGEAHDRAENPASDEEFLRLDRAHTEVLQRFAVQKA